MAGARAGIFFGTEARADTATEAEAEAGAEAEAEAEAAWAGAEEEVRAGAEVTTSAIRANVEAGTAAETFRASGVVDSRRLFF